MVDRIGQQIGNFRLTHILGTGGFAEVYLGEHLFLKSHAAIKLLHNQGRQALTESFLNEAQTIARLKHPHIIRVHDFGIDPASGALFLVMDYAPHGSLRQRHPEGSLVPLATVVSYVKQVASALQYAHDLKIIHRDIKPENMLLGDNQEVIVSDFGLAAVAHRTMSLQTQGDAGTIFYMAPEQIHGKPRRASDQYALGVTVYEWLCGLHPFSGQYAIEIAMQHVTAPPPSLRQHVPELAANVEQVVLKALAKDPQQRFARVQDFANALEQAWGARERVDFVKVPPLSSSPLSPAAPKMPLSANDTSSFRSPRAPVSQPLPQDGSNSSKRGEVPRTKAIAVPHIKTAYQTPLPSAAKTPPSQNPHVPQRGVRASKANVKALDGAASRSDNSLPRPSSSPLSGRSNRKKSHSRRGVIFLIGLLLVLFLASAVPLTLTVGTSLNNAHATATAGEQIDASVTAFVQARTTQAYNPAVTANGIMFGFDQYHTHDNPYEKKLTPLNVSYLVQDWVSASTGNTIDSSPAVANGVVYVGSEDDKLYAFDAASGQVRWSTSTGRGIVSSPAIVNGVVYVGSEDHKLYAFDAASGQVRWSTSTGNAIYSSPAVANGVVYVSSYDDKLYAFDAASGQVRWSTPTGSFISSGSGISSSPTVANGVVYVGSEDDKLYAFDAASGQVRWSTPTGNGILSSPAVANGVVYVGSEDDKLYAFDAASGQVRWSTPTGGFILSSPAVANGVVYVGSTNDKLYAFDAASGQVRWSTSTEGYIDSSPTVANGVVYVGSYNDNLYAFDAASGQVRWSTSTGGYISSGGGISSSPTVANGVVYVGSYDDKLYAFHLPGTTP